MDKNQAQEIFGLKAGQYSPEEVKVAYASRKKEIEEKIKNSQMEELSKGYSEELKKIEDAHNILLSSDKTAGFGNLSDSMMLDLPIDRPIYTNIGFTSLSEQVDASVALSIGRVLAGRYEILGLIDVGGMGAVYSAHDRIKDEDIAIKVLLPRLISNSEARRRFLNEAKIAASLSHPGIVNVFDVQVEGNLYFITMEKLEGCSLRAAMKERKSTGIQWNVEEVSDIGYQLCEALSFAHGSAVHRDIKPENIWLCKDNRVKIMDFGIARFMSTEQLTSTSLAMGTAYYMAPEQIHNAKGIDHRADQYSVGSVLYELLTEQVPSGRFKAPNKIRKDIPSGLSHSILRALEPNPGDRFPDIADFGTQVKKCRIGFFQQYKYIAWPAMIIAVFLLSIPILKTPTISLISKIDSIISPIDQNQVNYVKNKLLRLEIVYQNIEKLKQYEGNDIQKEIQLLKSQIQNAQSLKDNEEYHKAYELLSTKIEEALSVLNGQFYTLSFESNERCRLSIEKFEAKKNEVKKACEEANSRYNTQPRSPILDAINCELARMFDIQLNSEVMIKAKALHTQASEAKNEKQFFLEVVLLDETTRKYNDFYSWIEIARTFITARKNNNLLDALNAYRSSYPFMKEPFYLNFKKKDDEALKTLSNGQADAAYKQFNDLKADLEKAKVLADRYNKYQQLLRSLSSNVPKSLEKRYNEIAQQLNGAAGEIANHDFNKASGTFESVESKRLKLLDDCMDVELKAMEIKKENGEIYPVLILLSKFKTTWGDSLEKSTGIKNRLDQLSRFVKKPVIMLGDGVALELVYIPGGSFQMGSPKSEAGRDDNEDPVHPVELDGFWMGKYEITQEQYRKIMGDNPSQFKRDQDPVVNVTWIKATDFCEILSQKTRKNFRLPTEAEWEYACRAGSNTPHYWGYQPDASKCSGENDWGLRNMSGSAWEWCADWFGEKYYQMSPRRNPKGPITGPGRVFRGGALSNPSRCSRSSYRGSAQPATSLDNLGFRVVFAPERQ